LIPHCKKIVGETTVPGGGCSGKPWSFYSACKNFSVQHTIRAEIWSSEKVDLGGYDCTSESPWLVDQSSRNLFRRMQEETLSIS